MTQQANDSAQLLPAVDRMENQLPQMPRKLVADGGYSTRDNIEKMAERGIDFLGSMGREEMPSGTTAPKRLSSSAFFYDGKIGICIRKVNFCATKGGYGLSEE